MKKSLVIVGISSFAEIAYEYFSETGLYDVVAFSVDREYKKSLDYFLGLPVLTLEEVDEQFSNQDVCFFVAITYTSLNRGRTRIYKFLKSIGLKPASYISKYAFISSSANIGEHVFIMENNVIQSQVTIGTNVILWSGNHIGHHSQISDNCFISSHVVISGHCHIGEYCFLGVNSTVNNNINISNDCWIDATVHVSRHVVENQIIKSIPNSKIAGISSSKFFKL